MLAPGILTSPFALPSHLSFPGGKAHTILSASLEERKQACLGMARVTLGGPFLKEPPRTSPTGFPRGTAVFGKIKMVCAGWPSHGFLCLTFPPPCILMSLSLLFAQPC